MHVQTWRPPLAEAELPAEDAIMAGWPEGSPRISIICATYNHERWIADALCGFLSQRTAFPFEILVGEDCSTDNTSAVVQRIARRYPRLVRVFSGTRNLGARANHRRLWEAARGEWIAFCEGDDFWVSRDKLAVQMRLLDANPDVDICGHAAQSVQASDCRPLGRNGDYGQDMRILSTAEVMRHEHGVLRTASLMVRRNVLLSLPDWFYPHAPMGDYYIEVLGGRRGGCAYLPDELSAYRADVDGGWTARLADRARLCTYVEKSLHCAEHLKTEFPASLHADIDHGAGSIVAYGASLALRAKLDDLFIRWMRTAREKFAGRVPAAYRWQVRLRRCPALLRAGQAVRRRLRRHAG